MLAQGDGLARPEEQELGFTSYRERLTIAEMYVSGMVRKILGIEGMVRLRPIDFLLLWRVLSDLRRPEVTLSHVYYLLRAADGYSQQLQPDGQVYYYSYLSGRQAADKIRPVLRRRGGFNYSLLAGRLNNSQFDGLREIIELLTGNGRESVVWRPPVDSWLYE